jgi:hypothetical protein
MRGTWSTSVVVAAVVVVGGLGQEPPAARRQEPSVALPAGWSRQVVHGFDVRVKDAFRGTPAHDEVLALLGQQLFTIGRRVGDTPLAALRTIPIWVGDEAAIHREACMFYHPSPQWLARHEPGREFLARGVEIANAANFLRWCHDQPFMVLHELAHGHHHLVLGHGHAGIRAAFGAAKQSGVYDRVLHIGGGEQRHYALTNEQEWFAEATEAWFGTNDFWPFVRAELQRADPRGAAELQRIWGEPRR